MLFCTNNFSWVSIVDLSCRGQEGTLATIVTHQCLELMPTRQTSNARVTEFFWMSNAIGALKQRNCILGQWVRTLQSLN